MTTGDILATFVSSIGIGLLSVEICRFSLEKVIDTECQQLFLDRFVKSKGIFNKSLLFLHKTGVFAFAIFIITLNTSQEDSSKKLPNHVLIRAKLLSYIYVTFALLIFKNFYRYKSAPERILLILAALVYLYFLINLFLFLRKLETFTANQPQEPPEE